MWNCVIVIQGMPSSARSVKYIGIEWRNFHIRDIDIHSVNDNVEDCGKAYVTVYKGKYQRKIMCIQASPLLKD